MIAPRLVLASLLVACAAGAGASGCAEECTSAQEDGPPEQDNAAWSRADVHRIASVAGFASYRDWSIACDNRGACQGISLSAARAARLAASDPGDHARPLLSIARAHRTAPWQISVDYRALNYAPQLDGLSLHVMHDRSERIGPAFRLTAIEPGLFMLDPAGVESFLRDSRRSSRVATTMRGHGIHGVVSTAGLSASLTAIDARQTVAPRIGAAPAVAPSIFNPVHPGEGEAAHLRRLGCDTSARAASDTLVSARSPDGEVVTGVPCGGRGWRMWMVGRDAISAAPIRFPTPDAGAGSEISGSLRHSVFNLDTGDILAARRIGTRHDCGWSRRWRWTGRGFALLETRIMPFCAGLAPDSWFVVYSGS